VIGIYEITYALYRPIWDSRLLLFAVLCRTTMMRRHPVEALETIESQRENATTNSVVECCKLYLCNKISTRLAMY
jgi:hypothetical protein